MENKTIVISLPSSLNDYKIIREIHLDDDYSIRLEITDRPSYVDFLSDGGLFFCHQHKQKVVFNPFDYAYIESTSNHYSIWHPINPTMPILTKYTDSLDKLHSKLKTAGVHCFWRVHDSYMVNRLCIKSLVNDKIILNKIKTAIPIGREYKEEFLHKAIII